MKHYYYLHTNGDLIHKVAAVVDSDPQYFDSPFVRRVWTVDTEKRGDAWNLVIQALALGANKPRIKELQEVWGLTNEDAHEFAKRNGFKLSNENSKWIAMFQNQDKKSIAGKQGVGDDCLEALADLLKQTLISQNYE